MGPLSRREPQIELPPPRWPSPTLSEPQFALLGPDLRIVAASPGYLERDGCSAVGLRIDEALSATGLVPHSAGVRAALARVLDARVSVTVQVDAGALTHVPLLGADGELLQVLHVLHAHTPVRSEAPSLHETQEVLLDDDAGAAVPAAEQALRPLVLVVEDDPLIRQVICEALGGHYRTEVAADGADGLRRAVLSRPDLVLSDLTMPMLTGVQLLHALRTVRALDETPVVILTSSSDEPLRVQLLREGAQDFIQKPFSVAELRVRVDNLVHAAQARRALKQELASQRDDLELLAEEVVRRKQETETALEAVRAARDHAEHASEAKGAFLGLVSHELRTPLAALGLQVHLLRSSTLSGRQKELTERIERSSGRLLTLIEALLERARIDAGGVTAQLAELDLGDVIEGVVAEHAQAASRKGLALGCSGVRGLCVVSDAQLVRLLLSSLVDNAVKFTERGEVTLVAALEADHVRVSVRDTGPGIGPAQQVRLFSPFEHLTPIEHKHVPGFGLGLALVRDLAQALGARVEIASTVGVGSTFTLRLPRDPRSAPASVAER